MNPALERLGNTRLDRRRLLQTAGAVAVTAAAKPFERQSAGTQATETPAAFELTSNSLIAPLEEVLAAEGPITFSQFRTALERIIGTHPDTKRGEFINEGDSLELQAGEGTVKIDLNLDINGDYFGGDVMFRNESGGQTFGLGYYYHNDETSLSNLYYSEADARVLEILPQHPLYMKELAPGQSDLHYYYHYFTFHNSLPDIVGHWRPGLLPILESIREAVLTGGDITWSAARDALNVDAMTTIADGWTKRLVTNLNGPSAVDGGAGIEGEYWSAFAKFAPDPEKLKEFMDKTRECEEIIRNAFLNYGGWALSESPQIPYEPQMPVLPEILNTPQITKTLNAFSRRGLPDMLGDNLLRLAQTFGFLQGAGEDELPVFTAALSELPELPTLAELKPEPLSLSMRAETV